MEDLGYESHNSVLILGSLWIFAIFYFIRAGIYIFFWILWKYKIRGYKVFYKIRKWRKTLFYSEILSISLDGYIEWLIAGTMNLKRPITSHGGDLAGNFTSIMCIAICLFAIPLTLIYHAFQSPERLTSDKRYIRKFGFFIEDIRMNSKWS